MGVPDNDWKSWMVARRADVAAAIDNADVRRAAAACLQSDHESNVALTALFHEAVRLLQPSICCDIGAHDGRASIALRNTVPASSIHAFEANPHIHRSHCDRAELSGIRYLNLAIGDQVGEVSVFAPRTLSKMFVNGEVVPASLHEPEDTGKTSLLLRNEDATYKEFRVGSTTLDAYFESLSIDEAGQTFALWIDVEGAADCVLFGASNVLARTVALVVEVESFEFWRDQKQSGDIIRYLVDRGFVPAARDHEYGDKQFNVLFLRHDVCAPHDAETPVADQAESEVPGLNAALQNRVITPARASRSDDSISPPPQAHIPVLVPSFNNPTYLKAMIDQLERLKFEHVVVVDNASTYPAMLDYLDQIERHAMVIRRRVNDGPRCIFQDESLYAELPQWFCVTDPDLAFNPALPDDFLGELMMLTEGYKIGKAGFAIDIFDRSRLIDRTFTIAGHAYKIWEWEARFWEKPVPWKTGFNPVFRAPIDTTFSVYNKRYFDPSRYLEALRVAGDYTCRHLPWYRDAHLPEDESRFYRASSRYSYYLGDSGRLHEADEMRS